MGAPRATRSGRATAGPTKAVRELNREARLADTEVARAAVARFGMVARLFSGRRPSARRGRRPARARSVADEPAGGGVAAPGGETP